MSFQNIIPKSVLLLRLALSNALFPEVVVNEVGILYQDALAKHRNGDVHGAEQGYRAILSAVPDHAGAWHFIGIILHQRKEFDEVISCLKKAIEICDTNSLFYENYDVVLLESKHYKRAYDAFQKAIMLDPDNRKAQKHLAGLCYRRGTQLTTAERFVESNQFFCKGADIAKDKELWKWKSLGFCLTIFHDNSSIDRYRNTSTTIGCLPVEIVFYPLQIILSISSIKLLPWKSLSQVHFMD